MYGVTIICDSWTGSIGLSIINFMVYCNGIIFFHKSVDCTGQPGCGFHIRGKYHASKHLVLMYVKLLLTVCISCLHMKFIKLLLSLV
jgi:hypothetical protein